MQEKNTHAHTQCVSIPPRVSQSHTIAHIRMHTYAQEYDYMKAYFHTSTIWYGFFCSFARSTLYMLCVLNLLEFTSLSCTFFRYVVSISNMFSWTPKKNIKYIFSYPSFLNFDFRKTKELECFSLHLLFFSFQKITKSADDTEKLFASFPISSWLLLTVHSSIFCIHKFTYRKILIIPFFSCCWCCPFFRHFSHGFWISSHFTAAFQHFISFSFVLQFCSFSFRINSHIWMSKCRRHRDFFLRILMTDALLIC